VRSFLGENGVALLGHVVIPKSHRSPSPRSRLSPWSQDSLLMRKFPTALVFIYGGGRVQRKTLYGNANTMTADVPEPPKKPDTTPEVVATYCLPPTSYVTTPPPMLPPVLNR